MREFVGKRHRQAGLIRKHVNKSTAYDDGVTHAEGLQRRSEQDAGTHGPRQIEVIGNFQVVDHGLQNLVNIPFRRQQSGALQAFDYIVFRLLLPLALSLQR